MPPEISTEDNEIQKSLPSNAAVIHEEIRLHGQQELSRDVMALFLSAIAAGLSMGLSLLVKALLLKYGSDLPMMPLFEHFGYSVGFIVVIIAHQQLFTENTITAVLPVMQSPRLANFILLFRLWGTVLIGNFTGTALASLTLLHWPIQDAELQKHLFEISAKAIFTPSETMFLGALVSGWLVATMVWMFPFAGGFKIVVILMMTWIMSVSGISHIIVGSVEAFYLVFSGHLTLGQFIWPFALPTLAGNIVGGTLIFALLSHVQIRSDLSDQRCYSSLAPVPKKGTMPSKQTKTK